ncbi:hypothetical protein [Bacillus wiedmannii]|uniref:hypothetical protein n=1 Tax=Bacillus wiedmannii TaxID=1890302 RepID=UPI000BF09D67|nr:hypothetical protein [Bacillus wiedmannii]PEO37570.1 hypothetical protein CN555_17430 [Bacillus wiedmannii]
MQKEYHQKLYVLAKENVQLTTNDCLKVERMVEQIGENASKKESRNDAMVAEEATKRETTRGAYQIISYSRKKLQLHSIEYIPNDLVDQHEVLLQGLTRKKLDSFMKQD